MPNRSFISVAFSALLLGHGSVCQGQDESPYPESAPGSWDLLVFAGSLSPTADLSDYIVATATYGLGLGRSLWSTDGREMRASFFLSPRTRFQISHPEVSGLLDIVSLSSRADYVFRALPLQPFVGIGLGIYAWKARIERDDFGLRKSGSGRDLGAILSLGFVINLREDWTLEPELSWHEIGGDISENLYSGLLVLRWKS